MSFRLGSFYVCELNNNYFKIEIMNRIFTLFCVAGALCLSAKAADPLMVMLDWDNGDNRDLPVFQAGESLTIEAYVSGGEEPYAYRWVTSKGEEVGTEATLSITATVPEAYRLFVTSADGQSATDKANVFVNVEEMAVATFDDLPLEDESAWPGDKLVEDPGAYDALFSGSFHFTNSYMPEYNYWCGYSFANEKATTFDGLQHQHRNVVGGGAEETANYGVTFMDYADTRIYVTHAEEGLVVPGMYVTNSAYLVNSALNGDGFCPKFTHDDKDYYKLVIQGLNEENEVIGKVEVMLIDFSEEEPYILSEWKYVDLTSLGKVHRLRLDRESTKQAYAPAYACIDQVGAKNPGAGIEAPAVASGIRLTAAADGILSVVGADGSWRIEIYSTDGVARASYNGHGATTVSTAALAAGLYIARVVSEDGEATLRFVRR